MLLIIEGVVLIIIGLLILIYTCTLPYGLRIVLALSRLHWMSFGHIITLTESPSWIARFYLVSLVFNGMLETRLTEAYEQHIIAKYGNNPNDPNTRLTLLQAKKNIWFNTAHLYEYRIITLRPAKKPVERAEPDLFGLPAPA